jgi:Flp pilus assembly pilin Flp
VLDKIIKGASPLLHRSKSRNGQTVVEYALVLVVISVLCVSYLSALGEQIRGLFLSIIGALSAAGNGF